MRLLLVDNVHLYKDESGNYFAPSIYNYEFIKRYLNVFEEVSLIAKVKDIKSSEAGAYSKVNGRGVTVIELPFYQGLKEMLSVLNKLIRIYRASCRNCDCAILRLAQIEGFFTFIFGNLKNIPYAVEMVNDPNTFVDMPCYMRIFSVFMSKLIIRRASGVSYVTEKYLQRIYKPSKGAFTTYYSSVELNESDIEKEPVVYSPDSTFRIVHVSNAINSDIKGHYTLIKAFGLIIEEGVDAELVIIGDGNKAVEYKRYVERTGLQDKVKFLGKLQRDELMSTLKTCNLMVLPTKMEGLPRTIIEAMSVGLPCLSSPTAGVPELIDEEYLFGTDDARGFADKIEYLVKKTDELMKMSMDNLKVSSKYTKSHLQKKRKWFYTKLREAVISR